MRVLLGAFHENGKKVIIFDKPTVEQILTINLIDNNAMLISVME